MLSFIAGVGAGLLLAFIKPTWPAAAHGAAVRAFVAARDFFSKG